MRVCLCVCPRLRHVEYSPPRTLLPTHRRPKLSQCRSSPSRCRVPLITNSRRGVAHVRVFTPPRVCFIAAARRLAKQVERRPSSRNTCLTEAVVVAATVLLQFSSRDFCFYRFVVTLVNAPSIRFNGSGHGFTAHHSCLGINKR